MTAQPIDHRQKTERHKEGDEQTTCRKPAEVGQDLWRARSPAMVWRVKAGVDYAAQYVYIARVAKQNQE